MSDSVVDTTFIALANEELAEARADDLLYKLVTAIGKIVEGKDRLRVNPKLLKEYEPHICEHRNDIVDQFVALLDSPETVRLTSSSLRRSDNAKAETCHWPGHDRHLLAAAINGEKVTIHVTEHALAQCAAAVKRIFGFKVSHVA
jgi:hypothetical protein